MILTVCSTFRPLRLIRFTPATLIAVAIVALAAFGVSARTWFAKPASNRKPALSAAQGETTVSSLEAILITLQPHGFEPAEVTRQAGPFLLAVDNRSGFREPIFRVDRVGGTRLLEVRMTKGKLGYRKLVDWPPGNYLLTEATHPYWVCQITITAP